MPESEARARRGPTEALAASEQAAPSEQPVAPEQSRAPERPRATTRAPASLQLDAYLPYRLSVTSNAVSRLIARAYEDRFGLTIPQWRLVAVLGEHGPLTQQAIAARTVMDKVTVSRATQGLVKRRFVQRAPHGADGRSHHLALSSAGRRLYDEVAPVALDYEARLLRHFEPAAVASLKRLLLELERAAGELAGME